jgi:hypothetical protein
METLKVDINTEEGYKKICDHLGIEKDNYEILKEFNILTEGNSDKKYIEELSRYFKIKCPNTISVNGADNFDKFLNFYNSYYMNSSNYKPKIRVILDNDQKGREVYTKLISKTYNWLDVEFVLLTNFLDNSNKNTEKNNTNNEIEDFIYPDLVCYLINLILKRKGLNPLNNKYIIENCQKPSFNATGIMNLCETNKNELNPDNGNEIIFTSSGKITNSIKESMAGLMKIEGNLALIKLLKECNEKYPNVKRTLEQLFTFY